MYAVLAFSKSTLAYLWLSKIVWANLWFTILMKCISWGNYWPSRNAWLVLVLQYSASSTLHVVFVFFENYFCLLVYWHIEIYGAGCQTRNVGRIPTNLLVFECTLGCTCYRHFWCIVSQVAKLWDTGLYCERATQMGKGSQQTGLWQPGYCSIPGPDAGHQLTAGRWLGNIMRHSPFPPTHHRLKS